MHVINTTIQNPNANSAVAVETVYSSCLIFEKLVDKAILMSIIIRLNQFKKKKNHNLTRIKIQ